MNVLVVVSTFLAAGVEWVEAFTIVLAVGIVKGWRSSVTGAVAAFAALGGMIAAFGAGVGGVPIGAARTVVGIFLLLFGLKWLHKAILRSSGLKALHDEAQTFLETRASLDSAPSRGPGSLDWVGVGTSFNGVFLEGLEVVFIVIALGGLNGLAGAATGAGASLVAVLALGLVLRTPLTRIPENTMKYVVGIMLTSFGTFFAGEGVGVHWWRSDLSLLPLIGVYALASFALVWLLRRPAPTARASGGPARVAAAAVKEVWGLFVGDGALAIATLAVLAGVAVFVDRVSGMRELAAVLLVAGVLAAVVVSLFGALRSRPPAVETEREPVAEPRAIPVRERSAH